MTGRPQIGLEDPSRIGTVSVLLISKDKDLIQNLYTGTVEKFELNTLTEVNTLEVFKGYNPDLIIWDTEIEGWKEFLREYGQRPLILLLKEQQIRDVLPSDAVYLWPKSKEGVSMLVDYMFHVLNDHHRRNQKEKKEELIRASRNQWMAIVDAITDYVYVVDNDYRIIKTNLAFAEHLNVSPEEIIGKRCYDVFNCRTRESCPKDAVSSAGRPYFYEKRKDGRLYQVSVYPFKEVENYTVHLMKDITEIQRLREHLYQTDKLTALGQMVSGIAHELNNPLTGIIVFSEMLMSLTSEDPSRQMLSKILNSAERCKRIVENLLTFARARKHTKSLDSLNAVIERTLELRNYWLKKNNIKVIKRIGSIPSILMDTQKMQEAIFHILLNAEQAIVLNGINNGRIEITTEYDTAERKIRIKIEDNGPGINPDIRNRIFEPFFTTKPVGIGTGLGLSIAYSIVSEHKGSIYIEESASGGTAFIIEIPVNCSV